MESLRNYLKGSKKRDTDIEKQVTGKPVETRPASISKPAPAPNPNLGIELTAAEKAEAKKYKSGGLVSRQTCKKMGKAC